MRPFAGDNADVAFRDTITSGIRALGTAGLLAFLLLNGGSAGAQVGGTISVSVAPGEIVYGSSVDVEGHVEAGAGCQAEREVRLLRRLATDSDWRRIDTATTGATGGFSFVRRPWYSAQYELSLPRVGRGTVVCARITSDAFDSLVHAAVAEAAARNPVRAGNCTAATVTVSPPKPGSTVYLERRTSKGWRRFATPVLDSRSRAVARLCYAWRDIGIVPLRARWPAQDELDAAGVTPVLRLHVARARWMVAIDRLTAGHAVSVVVKLGGQALYERQEDVPRAPASNEKLLQSMALLDRLGPAFRIATKAAAVSVENGVVKGDLWILGHGNPEITDASMSNLARAIKRAGVRRVGGSVMGSRAFFSRDWVAPGWHEDFPGEDVNRPTALTFDHNVYADPEGRAARSLTMALRAIGVRVSGEAGSGRPPAGLATVAEVGSKRLRVLLQHQNHDSDNFDAEVLGKLLGAVEFGRPGSIAKGAAAIAAWTHAHGVGVVSYDASGLSYRNRVSAEGIVTLLRIAQGERWAEAFIHSLPHPGVGTLEDRLDGVPLVAKTGTLEDISALSGWVRLESTRRWARFSILSTGLDTSREKDIEDAIVRNLWKHAH